MRIKVKQVLVFLVAVVAISFTLTSFALAAAGNPSAFSRQKCGGKDMTKMLNLSPAQKEQIQAQRSANREKFGQLRQQLRTKRQELSQELEKPNIDKSRIDSIVAETKTLMGEQLEFEVNNILAMKQILTPEQFKQLQERKTRREPALDNLQK